MATATTSTASSHLPGRARHPRSRAERQLLDELQTRLQSALALCETECSADAILRGASTYASERRPLAVAASGPGALASNGGESPSLFYAPARSAGVGLKHRGTAFAHAYESLPPEDDTALRHYGVQQLSDFARAEMLGEVSDYLPSYREEGTARSRFNALLARIQQHQLARTVQNELSARKPDALRSWNENRFHLAPVTGSRRVVPVDAWAKFIRGGGDPAKEGLGLQIMPDVSAERHAAAAAASTPTLVL